MTLRSRHLGFVLIIWLILVGGVANAHWRWIRDPWLYDASPPTTAVPLRWEWNFIASGRLQAEIERRLNHWWGLRAIAIRTDNTMNQYLFHETRPNRGVVLGRGDTLFSAEDVAYFNRIDVCVACDAFAARIAQLQRRLLATGRVLLPVIVPAKTTTARADLPTRWRRFDGPPRSDQQLYQPMVNALVAEQVVFVDGRARLLRLQSETGAAIFQPAARHWSTYPACIVYVDAITTAAAQLGLAINSADLPTCARDMPGEHNWQDLGVVLNVWGQFRSYDPPESPPSPPSERTLRPMVIGTSFMWTFARFFRITRFATDARFYFYDHDIFDVATQKMIGTVAPNDRTWRAWTLERNVYLVDLFEGYVTEAGFGPFLDQLEAALDQRLYTGPSR